MHSFAKARIKSVPKCSLLSLKPASRVCWDGIRLDSWGPVDNFSDANVIPVHSVRQSIKRRNKNGLPMWRSAWKSLINLWLKPNRHTFVEISWRLPTSLFTMSWTCSWSCKISSGKALRWTTTPTLPNGQQPSFRVLILLLNWMARWLKNLGNYKSSCENEEKIGKLSIKV